MSNAIKDLGVRAAIGYGVSMAMDRATDWYLGHQSKESRLREEEVAPGGAPVLVGKKLAGLVGRGVSDENAAKIGTMVHRALGMTYGVAASVAPPTVPPAPPRRWQWRWPLCPPAPPRQPSRRNPPTLRRSQTRRGWRGDGLLQHNFLLLDALGTWRGIPCYGHYATDDGPQSAHTGQVPRTTLRLAVVDNAQGTSR